MEQLLIILIILVIINILLILLKKPKIEIAPQLKSVKDDILKFTTTLSQIEKSSKDEFQRNRKETNENSKSNREEFSQSFDTLRKQLTDSIKDFGDLLKQQFEQQNSQQDKNTESFNNLLKEKFEGFAKYQGDINKQTRTNIETLKGIIENQLKSIREDNTRQLTEMRKTVDEKLQKSLNERLSQSFETVGKQLQAVQEGLGEMKNLAMDVGGLKKVLSNVKIRGSFGELQLEMLLEQILAPSQYEANVKTNPNSSRVVEFAIKLPGRDDEKTPVWLPIDAKFPKVTYEKLQEAYESGDKDEIETTQKNMEDTMIKMAKDIHDKYIHPPHTTDFGIMFLPFESIYAEVVRKASLLEKLQRDYKIIVTGPTTLAAILNSLQMGFRTLAIQKRSGEVWKVLGAVKKEFSEFGKLIEGAQGKIKGGLTDLEKLIGIRTRAIQKELREVETYQDDVKSLPLDTPHLEEGNKEK